MTARIVLAVAAVAVAAAAGCGSTASHATGTGVAACTKQIVAHPVNGPWPACKGLTHAQLLKATEDAMAQGATG